MKHLFIINPAAGSYNRTDEYSEIIHKVCRARNLDYTILVSTAPGETIRISRKAAEITAQEGEELRIYACGGDGTLNEVVKIFDFDRRGCKRTTIPQSKIKDF